MLSKIKLVAVTFTLFILQQDQLMAQPADDTVKIIRDRERSPRSAAIKSAILPGWGQVYNRKIWKVPVVYAALGLTGRLLAENVDWYRKYRAGVRVGDYLLFGADYPKDSTGYFALDQGVKLYLGNGRGLETLRAMRDDSRKNIVYAGLYFLVIGGLNVVDAAVDAHLSGFDVSDDISFGILPAIDIPSRTAGLALVVKTRY